MVPTQQHIKHSGTSVSLNPENENLRFVLQRVSSLSDSCAGEQFKDFMRHDTHEEFKDKTVKASEQNESQEAREKTNRVMISSIH